MTWKHFTGVALVGLLVAGPAGAETARGVITKVDVEKGQLVIQGKGKGSMTFSLVKDARVEKGKKDGKVKDLRVGRRVRVRYKEDGEKLVATSVRVMGRKAARANGRPILGRLQDIDLEDRQITVRGKLGRGEKRRAITLDLPDGVKVTRAGKPFKLKDLEKGTLVRVEHRTRGGQLEAQAIHVIDAQALIDRTRHAMNRLDFYLKMAELYLNAMKKPKHTEPKENEED